MGRRARTTSLRRLRCASAFAMVLAIVALCLACAPMASAAGAGAGAKRTFPDVNASTPHAEDIAWLAETGISTGFPDGTFRGGDAVTRQDMAAFLRRLARLMGDESAAESKKYTCSFTDVTDATPHADDIAWLAETGISTGYPDNTFRGMAAVCRQDMAAFLRRLAAREGVGDAASWDGEPGGFPDVGATADHAADIAWLAATGVSTGYPDGTFRGMAAVARQDMAAFLHRLHKLPQDGPGEPPSYAEWAARMVRALENDDASPNVSEENLADTWSEAKRIGIIPFDVEDRDAVATRDFALCCAALTCGFTDEGIESDAPDASASQHPALIDAALKAGIGKADPDGKIRPGDAITGSEADAAEARVQELLAAPATSEPMSNWKPAPGVEEIADAVEDGERYIVPVPASEIKAGDKVILEPSDAMPLGAAGTVQSVEDAGTGNARIAIKQAASLDEVFDEVHVSASNVPLELGVAARAAGLDERSNERISGAYEIPFSYHPSEEVSIDGNITVSATLKIDWKKGLAPSRVTAVLSPSASLKVEAVLEQDFDGVEISLLPVDLSIPLGITGASIDFNATIAPSLNGHLSLSTSAHFSAGVDYFDGHFRAVRDAGIDLPELEGELTFDLGPNAGFAFFGIDIASIQPKIIPGIWGRMNFRETGMVCSDVAAYVGMGLTGKLDILDPFSAFIDNTFDFVQIGREETPLKWDWHWENGRLVPTCTYQPASNPGDDDPSKYNDIGANTPHYVSILWLIHRGIANSWINSDGTLCFRPYSNTSRADMALFLYRLAGKPDFDESKAETFTDIDSQGEYRRAILWLSSKNITQGWDNGDGTKSYRPHDDLTREQMSVFLYRFAGEPEYDEPATSPFCDVSDSSSSRRAILWICDVGLSLGWGNGDGTSSFRPQNPIPRCDMAHFIHRFSDLDLSVKSEKAQCVLYSDGSLVVSSSKASEHSHDAIDAWQGLGTSTWYEKKAQYKNRICSITVNGRVKAPSDFENMGDGLFQHLPHLTSLDLKDLDMSKTVFCSSMLYGCESLQSLDLSNKDLGSLNSFSLGVCGVENLSFAHSDMHNLYLLKGLYNNSSIKHIDFSNSDLSSMSDWSQTFQGSSLQTINFSGARLAEYCEFNHMFADCPYLSDIDLSFSNYPSASTLTCMFASCPSIKQLDLSRISPTRNQWGSRIEAPSMFENCSSLQTISGIDQWDLGDDAWTMHMFDGCPAPRPPWYTEMEKAA